MRKKGVGRVPLVRAVDLDTRALQGGDRRKSVRVEFVPRSLIKEERKGEDVRWGTDQLS